MTACNPPPVPYVEPSNAEILAQLRAAYHRLLAGEQRAHLRYRERETTYARSDLNLLRQEIRRYEILVRHDMGQTSRTVQVGPVGGFPLRHVF